MENKLVQRVLEERICTYMADECDATAGYLMTDIKKAVHAQHADLAVGLRTLIKIIAQNARKELEATNCPQRKGLDVPDAAAREWLRDGKCGVFVPTPMFTCTRTGERMGGATKWSAGAFPAVPTKT